MKVNLQQVLPGEIEKRSFEIITEELGARALDPVNAPVIKRVIHTTADFDYYETLSFSAAAVNKGIQAIKGGASIVTDTQMARSGINKEALSAFGGEVFCFMADEDVKEAAKEKGSTRARASMDKAAGFLSCGERPKDEAWSKKPLIFAIGNAPTALVRLYELIKEEKLSPALVIGVPVGFVNVVESKELIMQTQTPYIVARGRKGGSNVAAAICNAMLYMARDQK